MVEIDAVADDVGIVEIDADKLGEREIAFAVAGRADFALDRIAGAQAIFADLVRRHIDVVGAGEIIGLRVAEETEAVGEHFDGARSDDLLARSEEHTSELQSLMRISYAVFCLKKKKEKA